MKKIIPFLLTALLLTGCAASTPQPQIAATTLPVYEMTVLLTQGTPLTVGRLVTESVSCLHDYALQVNQVKLAEGAETLVISGAHLEEFMEDLLVEEKTIDASQGIPLLVSDQEEEAEGHHHVEDGHHHEADPHIWLDPANAKIMATNICAGLTARYPQYRETMEDNLSGLLARLDAIADYGTQQLRHLRSRELITFHDGFGYFAQAFDLRILAAIEEESGSEASAKELIGLIELVREHNLPAIFTERSGSPSAASIIAGETGVKVAALDMAMAGDSFLDAMIHNIDATKEALQ